MPAKPDLLAPFTLSKRRSSGTNRPISSQAQSLPAYNSHFHEPPGTAFTVLAGAAALRSGICKPPAAPSGRHTEFRTCKCHSYSPYHESHFPTYPFNQLSFSNEPEFWPCTAPSSGQHAGFRTRPPVPKPEEWSAPSLRETVMSRILFVFALTQFPVFLASLLLLTLASLTHKDHIRYLLSTGKTEWENMERYIDGL